MYHKRGRLLSICAAALIASTIMCSYAVASDSEEVYEGVIRFHVRANSNSEEDQALKLLVRDGVLEEVNRMLEEETVARFDEDDLEIPVVTDATGNENSTSLKTTELALEDMRELLGRNMETIRDAALSVIEEQGYDYDVAVNLGIEAIPRKTYGDVTFPAGYYEALTINIGDAAGDNWWCVLFPQLCLIDPSGESLAGLETDSIGKDSLDRNRNTIILRFKSKELFDKIT